MKPTLEEILADAVAKRKKKPLRDRILDRLKRADGEWLTMSDIQRSVSPHGFSGEQVRGELEAMHQSGMISVIASVPERGRAGLKFRLA